MFRFLETDIREQKKYEKRIQTSVDNTVNDLRYEINFKIVLKTKIAFLLTKTLLFIFKQYYILFMETHFCKIPRNLISSAIFFGEADTKKHRYALGKSSNAALVKFTN